LFCGLAHVPSLRLFFASVPRSAAIFHSLGLNAIAKWFFGARRSLRSTSRDFAGRSPYWPELPRGNPPR
jgi:hypothetical protein